MKARLLILIGTALMDFSHKFTLLSNWLWWKGHKLEERGTVLQRERRR